MWRSQGLELKFALPVDVLVCPTQAGDALKASARNTQVPVVWIATECIGKDHLEKIGFLCAPSLLWLGE